MKKEIENFCFFLISVNRKLNLTDTTSFKLKLMGYFYEELQNRKLFDDQISILLPCELALFQDTGEPV